MVLSSLLLMIVWHAVNGDFALEQHGLCKFASAGLHESGESFAMKRYSLRVNPKIQ